MNYKSKLPCSPDAEKAILGAILQSGVRADSYTFDFIIQSGLKPDHFFNKQYRDYYEAFVSLREENKSINTVTFAESEQGRKFDPLTLADELVGFVDSLQFSPSNEKALKETVDILKDHYQRRSLIIHYRDQERYVFDPEIPTETALAQYESSLSDFDVTTAEVSDIKPLSETIADTFNLIEDRLQGNNEVFLKTGWHDFDEQFGGIPIGITVLAARPAMGKTSAALTLALQVAQSGRSVLYASLEMSRDQLQIRLYAAVTGINSLRLLRPKESNLNDHEINSLVSATDYLNRLPIFIEDDATSIEELLPKIQSWARRNNQAPDLVIIDYLQILESDQRFKEGYDKVTHLSKKLRAFGNNFRATPTSGKTPLRILCLSQLNRSVESRNNKRPMMSDIRESGQIEQDASLIVTIYRDEVYNPDTEDIGLAEISAVKNRNAPCGTIKLLFQAETTSFLNFAGSPQE